MALEEYKKKRRFERTSEPGPTRKTSQDGHLFVIQKHQASRLHYDLRLEHDGVLKSWAVPKGPSLDPSVKRLAMAVEDHPVDYAEFEGTIPEGEYGGGTVMIWDRGTYLPEGADDVAGALKRGELKVAFNGSKLKGSWVLVRTRNRQWLFIKHRDRHASTEDVTQAHPTSVLSGRTLAEIAADEGGNVEKATKGDRPSVQTTPPRRASRRSSS